MATGGHGGEASWYARYTSQLTLPEEERPPIRRSRAVRCNRGGRTQTIPHPPDAHTSIVTASRRYQHRIGGGAAEKWWKNFARDQSKHAHLQHKCTGGSANFGWMGDTVGEHPFRPASREPPPAPDARAGIHIHERER